MNKHTSYQNYYDSFDIEIDRQDSDSEKWHRYPPSVIPLWVADTDFCAPDFIVDALQQRLNHGVFGYGKIAVNLGAAIKKHLAQRYQWDIDSNQIVYLPGLVSALHLCVRCFSEEGDTIVVPSPVYYHLNKAPALAKRNLVNVDMILDEDLRWIPDFQALEQACAQTRCKMLLLCNPHNPGGTVYSREELEKVSHIAEKYNILIVSDEIHCDLILDKHSYHTPFASLNNDAAMRSITLMSPSKTYNIAGLGFAFAVIPSPTLKKIFDQARSGIVSQPTIFGLTAAEAAYLHGDTWHSAMIDYLINNRKLMLDKLNSTNLKLSNLQATYLEWIDASCLNVESPYHYFLQAGIATSDGKDFGNPNFIRLNFGCPKSRLSLALDKLLAFL